MVPKVRLSLVIYLGTAVNDCPIDTILCPSESPEMLVCHAVIKCPIPFLLEI